MVESRIHSLVRLSSVFCKTLRETATRQWILNPALFRVCANVPLVSVLSTFLFSSIFVESEYATFSMVRAPHANSAIKKALFLYFGDNDNPDYSANGASAVWPVIEYVPNTPTPTPTPTCTPKLSWQVNDANGNWINRNYDASLYVEETESGKFCTKNSDGFVEAALCIGPKTNPKVTSTWGLTSSWVRNLTYTDCNGNVTTATDVELTRRTGTCASETNS